MSERFFEEIALDPEYLDKYLGIRIEFVDGKKIGRVVAVGNDPDEIHAQIRRDQHIRTRNTLYLFYKPVSVNGERESWAIGGEL